MAVNLLPIGNDAPYILPTGVAASGYKLFTYTAGSSAKANTYTDNTGNTANANPIILNSSGYPASAGNVVEIWGTSGVSYKFVLAPSTDTDPPTSPLWTRDNIASINDVTATANEWITGPTPTYLSATTFSLVGDQTGTFQAGRRLKTTNTAGTIYSYVVSSAFAAVTTVTVVNDSGSLDSGLSAVSYGILAATNPSVPLLADTYPVVSGSADKTKKVRMEADNLTTATTRVLTVQDKNGTLALTADTPPRSLANVGLAVTMAANAVTIALKQSDGSTDATTGNPASVGYRSATITSSASSTASTTAALSTVISSGSTGGTVSAVASRIWAAGILVAGANELAWFNAGSQTNGTFFDEGALISTTAEGGAGNADSQGVWYSTTARANVPFTILGYFDSTQATAGTWATSVTDIVVNPRYTPVRTINIAPEQVSTSGTSIDFNSIPAGVRRITIMFVGVSTNGTSSKLIQIGDSGGIENTGYLGASSVLSTVVASANFTTGTGIASTSASDILHGTIVLTLEDASDFTWTAFYVLSISNAAGTLVGSSSKSLSAELDRVRITTVNGTDAYDAGVISISFE